MTRTVVDTEMLADAARAVGQAATSLGSTVCAPPAPAQAAGDPALAEAVSSLDSTWRTAHGALTGELGELSAALARAAALFDGAESATVRDVAGLLVPPSPAPVTRPPAAAV